MRDIAFAAFRIAAVVYLCTYLLPSLAWQFSFLPFTSSQAPAEERFLLVWGSLGNLIGNALFTAFLFFGAKRLSTLVPDKPLPSVTFDVSLLSTVTLIIAGIALIADGAGYAATLVQIILQWANIISDDLSGAKLRSPEMIAGSQIAIGVLFLFLANRR